MCPIVERLTNNISSFEGALNPSYTNAQGQFVTKNLCLVPTLLDYSKRWPQFLAKDAPRPAVLERTKKGRSGVASLYIKAS